MKFATFFFLLSLGCAVLAPIHGRAGWLLTWPAASFFGIALAYAGLGPRLLGKRPSGRLALWAVIAFLPYFLPTWLLWHALRRVGHEPACQEIHPGLWLGRRLLPSEVPPDIALVVDLTAEFAEPAGVRRGRRYLCLPTLDATVPSLDALHDLVVRIAQDPGPVLVHCASGHGRSAMVLAGVLIYRGLAKDVDEAERVLRTVRPWVKLSAGQRKTVVTLQARRP